MEFSGVSLRSLELRETRSLGRQKQNVRFYTSRPEKTLFATFDDYDYEICGLFSTMYESKSHCQIPSQQRANIEDDFKSLEALLWTAQPGGSQHNPILFHDGTHTVYGDFKVIGMHLHPSNRS